MSKEGRFIKGLSKGLGLFSALFLAATLAGAQGRGIDGYYLSAPDGALQGDPLFAVAEGPRPLSEPILRLKDREGRLLYSALGFYMPAPTEDGVFRYGFLIPIPMDAPGGTGGLELFEAGGSEKEAGESRGLSPRDFEIGTRTFMKEDIPLDSGNSLIRTAPDPEKTAQAKDFAAIFAQRDLTALHAAAAPGPSSPPGPASPPGAFSRPLKGEWRLTSFFGDRRRYLYAGGGSDSSVHQGIDLGAKEGTPVHACAAGRVAFAGERIVTGKTIVLEHLPGLFSIYMHLSRMDVGAGDVVYQEEAIGAVGSTGLSTGPHLHWETRIGLAPVNPLYWLERPVLDKDWYSGRIKPPAEGR